MKKIEAIERTGPERYRSIVRAARTKKIGDGKVFVSTAPSVNDQGRKEEADE